MQLHVHGHFECQESLAAFTRLPWLGATQRRTPVTLCFTPPQAPAGLGDGLRGACEVQLNVHAGDGPLSLPCSSLPVAWRPDGTPLPALAPAAFWDRLLQEPVLLHRLLWLLSDHGLPRSFRTLALHGRGAWRLTDAAGRTRFAKLQALPLAGLQSLVRDEGERLAGLRPDLHARELGAALAAGANVGFELALQVLGEDEAAALPFDLLDASTLLPEELAPLRYAGRLVLERIGDAPAQGTPLAQPGFEPAAPARRHGDPFALPALFWRSLSTVEQRHLVDALRVALVRAADPAQREPVVALLGQVDAALARRVADGLGLVPPEGPAHARAAVPAGEAALPAGPSAGLSLLARPGDGRLAGRRVALLVADGVEATSLERARRLLGDAQVQLGLVGARLGTLRSADGTPLSVDSTFDAAPSVCWDALVLPEGAEALPPLCADGRVLAFVRETYRHAKPLLQLGRDLALLRAAGIPVPDGASADPGLVVPPPPVDDDEDAPGAPPDADAGAPLPLSEAEAEALLRRFIGALARHRHHERELDPPLV